jgi:alpha-1,2-mannosyltransferase
MGDAVTASPARIEQALVVSALVVLALGALDLGRALLDPATVVTSDFAVFRAGGSIVLAGGDPYDRAAQEAAMAHVLGTEREGGHLAFLLPPHAAMLFAPLAAMPLGLAFAVFGLLSASCLARLVVVLAELAGADRRLVAIVVVALGSVASTFRLGQLAILLSLLLAELARAVRDGRDVRTGVALGLLSLKPPFVPIALAYLAGARRWRALGIAAATVLALALPTLGVLGPDAWLRWATQLGGLENAFAVATPPYMVCFRGTLARLLGDPERRALTSGIAWAAFLVVAGLAFALGRSRPGPRPFTLAVALGLLFSPHLFFHDLLAWSVPIALARGSAGADGRRPWVRLALAAPVALFVAAAVEPALGMLLPVAPQLLIPLAATERLVRERRARNTAPAT